MRGWFRNLRSRSLNRRNVVLQVQLQKQCPRYGIVSVRLDGPETQRLIHGNGLLHFRKRIEKELANLLDVLGAVRGDQFDHYGGRFPPTEPGDVNATEPAGSVLIGP